VRVPDSRPESPAYSAATTVAALAAAAAAEDALSRVTLHGDEDESDTDGGGNGGVSVSGIGTGIGTGTVWGVGAVLESPLPSPKSLTSPKSSISAPIRCVRNKSVYICVLSN
jgi:hypothetical protein